MSLTDNEISLKDRTSKLNVINDWPPSEKTDQMPRALKNLGNIISSDLCHRCGSCIGICPTEVLSKDNSEYPTVKNLSACTDCDLCVKVCPGLEFNAPEFQEQLFGEVTDPEDMHGHFEKGYLTWANDSETREKTTSGGLVTALLCSLLDAGEIDGAAVIASDKSTPWKGKAIIARTPEEIKQSAKSKYAICPTNEVFSEIIKQDGRYALVGLPCQIHGYLKAAELNPKIKKRVVLTIGLLCHAAVEHEPMEYIWDKIEVDKSKVKKFISRVGKHPGGPHLELEDGTYHPVYFPKAKSYRPNSMEIINLLYRLYTPARCMSCYDSTAEYADIAVGDPWMPPPNDDIDFSEGYSYALARTKRGLDAISFAATKGDISTIELSKDQSRMSNIMMGTEKRHRAFYQIRDLEKNDKPIPLYKFELPKLSDKNKLKVKINYLTHYFCFNHKYRKAALKFIFSPLGYLLLRLNNYRRRLRTYIRDKKAKVMYK